MMRIVWFNLKCHSPFSFWFLAPVHHHHLISILHILNCFIGWIECDEYNMLQYLILVWFLLLDALLDPNHSAEWTGCFLHGTSTSEIPILLASSNPFWLSGAIAERDEVLCCGMRERVRTEKATCCTWLLTLLCEGGSNCDSKLVLGWIL